MKPITISSAQKIAPSVMVTAKAMSLIIAPTVPQFGTNGQRPALW